MPFDGSTQRDRNYAGFGRRDQTRAERDLRILREARVQIAARGGWHRGSLGALGVSMCAIGWLQHIGWAHGERDHQALAQRLLWPALPWCWRLANYGGLAAFNDAPWRRQKRMVQLYSRAIRLAERRL